MSNPLPPIIRRHRTKNPIPRSQAKYAQGKMSAIAQIMMGTGLTPIEILLNTMRMQYDAGIAPLHAKTKLRKGQKREPDWEMLEKATHTANLAAPYIHPKQESKSGIKEVSDDDLDNVILNAALGAGVPMELLPMLDPTGKTVFAEPFKPEAQAPIDDTAEQAPAVPRIRRRPATGDPQP